MTATAPDYDKIVRVVQLYVDVFNDCDISVTQAGDIASVLLGFDDVSDASDPSHGHGTSWVDFHTLLRINGVWKITNKTATHTTRAGWAADQHAECKEATVA